MQSGVAVDEDVLAGQFFKLNYPTVDTCSVE
jgi:hypothetical protein